MSLAYVVGVVGHEGRLNLHHQVKIYRYYPATSPVTWAYDPSLRDAGECPCTCWTSSKLYSQ